MYFPSLLHMHLTSFLHVHINMCACKYRWMFRNRNKRPPSCNTKMHPSHTDSTTNIPLDTANDYNPTLPPMLHVCTTDKGMYCVWNVLCRNVLCRNVLCKKSCTHKNTILNQRYKWKELTGTYCTYLTKTLSKKLTRLFSCVLQKSTLHSYEQVNIKPTILVSNEQTSYNWNSLWESKNGRLTICEHTAKLKPTLYH